MTHSFRPFEQEDSAAVVALWDLCGLTRPWNDPYRDIARKMSEQPELFLVAEKESTVGNRNTSLVGAGMAGYDGHRGWVNYLAVHPSEQGTGLGRDFMAEFERRLLERGCPKVNVQVRAGNEHVLGFYRSLGYAEDHSVSLGKRLIADDCT